MAYELDARGGLEKLAGNSVNEDRSPFADVCASLIELMELDGFLVGHPLGFQRCDDAVVIVGDDRLAAEAMAYPDDAVIEAVHEQKLIVNVGQKFSDCSSHGLALVRSVTGYTS